LPAKWRETFDLKGCTPTKHDQTRLIAECKAIERHVKFDDAPSATEKKGNNNNKKKARLKKSSRSSNEDDNAGRQDLYCKEHGENDSHNTNKCRTLELRRKQQLNQGKQ
jgi:hypothetical protein